MSVIEGSDTQEVVACIKYRLVILQDSFFFPQPQMLNDGFSPINQILTRQVA
ncbi:MULTISPECIES: hypothetical protein [unclassified Legionella]|uniref:hypothetical protein n=1 Tax=unclassified Legionella TaxID=2622702 RepID=UPI001E4166C5|nr:hypothetical protein [Legionella sp. 31fI33]MCC5014713.1 hypothetical protein [Legionella sp. 31fI33]